MREKNIPKAGCKIGSSKVQREIQKLGDPKEELPISSRVPNRDPKAGCTDHAKDQPIRPAPSCTTRTPGPMQHTTAERSETAERNAVRTCSVTNCTNIYLSLSIYITIYISYIDGLNVVLMGPDGWWVCHFPVMSHGGTSNHPVHVPLESD